MESIVGVQMTSASRGEGTYGYIQFFGDVSGHTLPLKLGQFYIALCDVVLYWERLLTRSEVGI